LSGQRTGRRRTIDRPPPQIAERTRERTLSAGEKNRQRSLGFATRTSLILD